MSAKQKVTPLKGPTGQPEYYGLEKAPISATSVSLTGAENAVLVSLYFNPPEDMNREYVLTRILLDLDEAEQLRDGLTEMLETIKKAKSKSK